MQHNDAAFWTCIFYIIANFISYLRGSYAVLKEPPIPRWFSAFLLIICGVMVVMLSYGLV